MDMRRPCVPGDSECRMNQVCGLVTSSFDRQLLCFHQKISAGVTETHMTTGVTQTLGTEPAPRGNMNRFTPSWNIVMICMSYILIVI